MVDNHFTPAKETHDLEPEASDAKIAQESIIIILISFSLSFLVSALHEHRIWNTGASTNSAGYSLITNAQCNNMQNQL